jgi:hypothetical protein
VEYAKGDVEDILVKISTTNRGPDSARLRLLPTVWFRNTWSWGTTEPRPDLRQVPGAIELNHPVYGKRWLYYEDSPEPLFTENETNTRRLFGIENRCPCVKDGINDYIVQGTRGTVRLEPVGTKAALHYQLEIGSGGTVCVRLRLSNADFGGATGAAFADFDQIFALRKSEADEFYATIIPQHLSPDAQNVMRQGFAGLLWSKQYYHYVVKRWLDGDPNNPLPPAERRKGRNHEWLHLYNTDVIFMPDKWEYPWYAAWDLAFHCLALALIDPILPRNS